MAALRLLKTTTCDAFTNMAIDEAILTARVDDLVSDTLRFYRWKPSAVSIGRFQKIENEVQPDNCKKNGVDVVRRITGGGAVYHDQGDEITYSLVASKESLKTQDMAAVYKRIYEGIDNALGILGVTADFDEGNARTCPNLTVNGRKVSGSAQCHKKGIVLQHGTLLVNVDLDRMFTFLRVPWAKTRMEIVKVAKSRITSINAELGREVSMEKMENVLVEGFQKALSIEYTESELTTYEQKLVGKLFKEKYATDKWNYEASSVLG